MKNRYIFLTSLLAFQLTVAFAQWSTDPANPGIVCDVAGLQSNPQAIADDNGGVYVFWIDNRLNDNYAHEVYGQHYDANGYALWEEDGRRILSHSTKINWFSASRIFNGEIIIGWLTAIEAGTDSLRIQRLNEDGTKIWENELIVANAGITPNYILGMYGYNIIHDNSGYCISIGTVYFGGSSGNRITRFSSDGVLTGMYNGEPEGTQYNYGSSGLQSAFDAAANIYIYYSTANGAGAELMCLKVNTAGDTIWGPVAVLTGTLGLSYQFSGISDADGITFVWQGNGDEGSGSNLYARRLNSDGVLAWSGLTLPVCAVDGFQVNFFWKRSGDNYYITWGDGRPGTSPGNYDIYAQKFDKNGTVFWNANGVLTNSTNTYSPFPEFDLNEDNSMVICHQTTTVGYIVQKVLDNGTVVWDENGHQVCTPIFSPFYSEHVVVYSGNKVISVWAKSIASGGSNDIYITRVDNTGVTGVAELNSDQTRIFPNPASDEVIVVLAENRNDAVVKLIDLSGKEVIRKIVSTKAPVNRLRISTSDIESGTYLICIEREKEIVTHKLIVKQD